jgi:parvulin-like peptidyl-prolyl isomerase
MRNALDKTFRAGIRRVFAILLVGFVSLSLFSTNALPRVIDGIAIIVNDDAILVSEINEMMMPLMQEYRARYAGSELKKKMTELKDTIIEQAIDTRLILQIAKQRGVTADEKNVESRIEAVKKRFPSEEVFLEALSAKGVTYKEYSDQVAEQVLVQETLRRVLGVGIDITDNEIREYYDEHPDEFITKPKVNLAQIFLQIPSGSTEEEIEKIRRKAAELHVLIEDGMDFSELAKKYSEGPFRDKGGIIGIAGPGEILPELEEIAFNLKTGETSEVIQTVYGFHLLQALEAFPARKVTFEEAQQVIEERIHETKRSEKYKDWMERLREDSYIDIKI